MRRMFVLGCAVVIGLAFASRLRADDAQDSYDEIKKAAETKIERAGKSDAEYRKDYAEQLTNVIERCDAYLKRYPAGAQLAEVYYEKAKALMILSNVRDAKENLEKALAAATEAIKTNPKSEPAAKSHGLFIQYYRKTGDKDAVMKEAQAIIRDYPEGDYGALAYLYIGETYEQMGKEKEAQEAFQAIVEKFPESRYAGEAQGRLAFKKLVGSTIELAFDSIDGQKINLKDYRGNIVIVVFWASWDAASKTVLPDVLTTYNLFQERGVRVVGISLDSKKDEVKAFMDKIGASWPTYYDPEHAKWDNNLARQFGVRAIPMTLLVDRAGKVREVGVLGRKLQVAIRKLLGESGTEKTPAAK